MRGRRNCLGVWMCIHREVYINTRNVIHKNGRKAFDIYMCSCHVAPNGRRREKGKARRHTWNAKEYTHTTEKWWDMSPREMMTSPLCLREMERRRQRWRDSQTSWMSLEYNMRCHGAWKRERRYKTWRLLPHIQLGKCHACSFRNIHVTPCQHHVHEEKHICLQQSTERRRRHVCHERGRAGRRHRVREQREDITHVEGRRQHFHCPPPPHPETRGMESWSPSTPPCQFCLFLFFMFCFVLLFYFHLFCFCFPLFLFLNKAKLTVPSSSHCSSCPTNNNMEGDIQAIEMGWRHGQMMEMMEMREMYKAKAKWRSTNNMRTHIQRWWWEREEGAQGIWGMRWGEGRRIEEWQMIKDTSSLEYSV